MAEAHQGVAFAFIVTEEEGLHVNVSLEALKAILLSGVYSWRNILARLTVKNYILLFNFEDFFVNIFNKKKNRIEF